MANKAQSMRTIPSVRLRKMTKYSLIKQIRMMVYGILMERRKAMK